MGRAGTVPRKSGARAGGATPNLQLWPGMPQGKARGGFIAWVSLVGGHLGASRGGDLPPDPLGRAVIFVVSGPRSLCSKKGLGPRSCWPSRSGKSGTASLGRSMPEQGAAAPPRPPKVPGPRLRAPVRSGRRDARAACRLRQSCGATAMRHRPRAGRAIRCRSPRTMRNRGCGL